MSCYKNNCSFLTHCLKLTLFLLLSIKLLTIKQLIFVLHDCWYNIQKYHTTMFVLPKDKYYKHCIYKHVFITKTCFHKPELTWQIGYSLISSLRLLNGDSKTTPVTCLFSASSSARAWDTILKSKYYIQIKYKNNM